MPSAEQLPWRGPGPGRPTDLKLPPDRLPLLGPGRRLRKRWRYVGVFCDEFLLCAARAQVGPFGQTFWAVVDRESGEMHERTVKRPPLTRGEVWSERADRRPLADRLRRGRRRHPDRRRRGDAPRCGSARASWAETVCPAQGEGERGYVWTRKRIAPVECDIELPGGRSFKRAAFGIEDESAGYHPRHTVWSWSAGVGTSADGRAVGWNLVSGVNDPPERSERAIWIDGEPSEPGPVSFAADLERDRLRGRLAARVQRRGRAPREREPRSARLRVPAAVRDFHAARRAGSS